MIYQLNSQEEINVARKILAKLEINKSKCLGDSDCVSRFNEMISYVNQTYLAASEPLKLQA